MAISIRLARVSDAEDVARLTAQLGYQVELPALKARLSRILARTDQRFFIAEIDGRPAGWLHAAVSDYVEAETFALIGGLVVDAQHRGKGIGTLLMQQAEDWCRQQGCSIVRLSSSISRAAAHRFYEHLGYTNIKTQYAFVKSFDPERQDLSGFVPRVDGQAP